MREAGGVLVWLVAPGHWEVVIIGGVIVLLFFGRRIPELMRSLGSGVTQFKKGLHEKEDAAADSAEAKALPTPKEQSGEDGQNVRAAEKETDGTR